jgi:Na+/proline symporter
MDELIARAMQGVDPDDPAAFWHIVGNLMALVPWWNLVIWQVVFVVVGGLLGWWKGRTKAGVIASLILGPFGWIVPFMPRRQPPPLPPNAARGPAGMPPLPGSKKR